MGMPYAAFWMSIITTRFAFLNPQFTVPIMDAITGGWQRGRRAKNLTYARWEDWFDRPLPALRAELGLAE